MVNRFLEGNFAPVGEEVTVTDLTVEGHLPAGLDGRYLRMGPNPAPGTDPETYHWFLGDGMVHGLRLRDGRAEWYRNRAVRSAAVARRLGEPVRPGPVHAGFDFAPNTNVVGHAGRLLALVEAGSLPYRLDDELGTVGATDFEGTLRGGYTAHPLVDPVTGEMHAVSYYWGWGNRVEYSVTGADGRVCRQVEVEVGASPMMHAFSLTERYVCIYDLPVTFDAAKATVGMPAPLRGPGSRLAGRAVNGGSGVPSALASRLNRAAPTGSSFPYSWNPDHRARVGLLPRDGGATDVRWFDVEPCYVYHPVNAYDAADGTVVIDLVRHDRTFDASRHGPDESVPTLDRWTVDPAAGKVIEERLDDFGQEFPRIDDRRVGRRHRYGYSIGLGDRLDVVATRILRHDLSAGTTHSREMGDRFELDEFVFVPSGPDSAEDDGVVMGFVYDREVDRSELLVVDATTLETVASVPLPVRVPHGFHGNWVPAANR